MQIDILTKTEQLAAIQDEWNALLKTSASYVPFLRMDYLLAWWEYRGGGEWKPEDTELYVLTGRDDAGKLIGGAPFFLNHTGGETRIMWIGSFEISDYLDFVATEETLPSFIEALLEHLLSDNAPDWDKLDLYNIVNTSPTLALLQEAAEAHGLALEDEVLQPCPYIPLPDSFESYLDSIEKKQSRELKRKLRKAENFIVPVSLRQVTLDDDLDAELDTFFEMMRTDEAKAKFLTPMMEKQMRLIIRAGMEGGYLRFLFLQAHNKIAGGHLNFEMNNRTMGYNSAINPEFFNLSPGQVLAGRMIEMAVERGNSVFDFMRGDEQYKYRLGAVERFVHRVVVKRG